MQRLVTIVGLLCLLVFCAEVAEGQTRVQGYAAKGSFAVASLGFNKPDTLASTYPNATVSVFDAGTTNLSTIYTDSTGVTQKSNPFFADSTAYWFFYANNGNFDVTISGIGVPFPFNVMSDVKIANATASGINGTGATNTYAKFTSSAAIGNSLMSESGAVVTVNRSGSTSAEIDFTAGGNGNKIGLKAPASPIASLVFTLPALDGSPNQVLCTNGAQVLSFCSPGTGLSLLNGLSASTQTFATGTSGTDFGIVSSGSTHTFNIPDASGITNRGLVNTGGQSFGGSKTFLSAPLFTSIAVNSPLYIGPSNAVTGLTPLTNGQVIAGVTGAAPTAASITGSNPIVVTLGAGTIAVSCPTCGTTSAYATIQNGGTPLTARNTLNVITTHGLVAADDGVNLLTTLDVNPAGASQAGIVTTGTQTIAGAKTFSSLPTFSSLTAGSIPFADTGGLIAQDNGNLFWDKANVRLGLGLNSSFVAKKLEIADAGPNLLTFTGGYDSIRGAMNSFPVSQEIFNLPNFLNGIAYGIDVPSGTGGANSQVNSIAGYVRSATTNGLPAPVAVYGQAVSDNGASVWAGVDYAYIHQANGIVWGREVDLNVESGVNGKQAIGLLVKAALKSGATVSTIGSTAFTARSNVLGINLGKVGGANSVFGVGIISQDGSMEGPGYAIGLGALGTGASQNSQVVAFSGIDSGSAYHIATVGGDLNGQLMANGQAIVNTSGKVLFTAVSTPDGARVFHNADQSVTTSTYTALAFNSERYNNGSVHSTSVNNSRLTAQRAGTYLISGSVLFQGNATGAYRYAEIRLNGSGNSAATALAANNFLPNGAQQQYGSLSCVYHLSANDYVELVIFQDSGAGLLLQTSGNFAPEFEIQYLGP